MASFEKRPGGWTARFRFIENGEERNIRLSGFQTRREAAQAVEAYQREHLPTPRSGDSMTFSALCESYMKNAFPQMKESTRTNAECRIRIHLLPAFGDKKIQDITPLDVLEWQTDELECSGYYTVRNARVVLGTIFSYGMTYLGITKNPTKGVKSPKPPEVPEEMHIWTPEQYQRVMDYIDRPILRLFFDTLYLTGMRKGEVLALTPDDICGNSISVTKTLTNGRLTTPKTASSVRKVSIPTELAARLHELAGPRLFGACVSNPGRVLDAAAKKAGLEPIRIHDLRHSHASFLISQGCSIVAVSRRLGHASPKQTLDVYSHVLPDDDDAILRILNGYGIGYKN